jgi:hypothetical protein
MDRMSGCFAAVKESTGANDIELESLLSVDSAVSGHISMPRGRQS